MRIRSSYWGRSNGSDVEIFTLSENGITLKLSNYGALIQSLIVPDGNDNNIDVVLGYDSLSEYEADYSAMGVVPAIFANRIANGQFQINGKKIQLDCKGNKYSLHAGSIGKKVWLAKQYQSEEGSGVKFSIQIEDSFEGFPGPINLQVTYFLDKFGQIFTLYEASAEQDTSVNLTNHAYFNLGENDILSHQVCLLSNKIVITDENSIATGEIRNIADTVFDFTKPKKIGLEINSNDPILNNCNGYDINYVIESDNSIEVIFPLTKIKYQVHHVADVFSEVSGIKMKLHSSQPGVQFYTGNSLDGRLGKNGKKYTPRSGFCLETQHFPNSPNIDHFPTTMLKSGENFSELSVLRFSFE
ncbi:MAG: aldose 1-epimerase [Francisellaceae bacterium]|jgi:aldose 1-epimerase